VGITSTAETVEKRKGQKKGDPPQKKKRVSARKKGRERKIKQLLEGKAGP